MIAEYCISGGTRNVKRTIFSIAFLSLLAFCLASCGSTDNLRTIQLTAPSTELQGIGGTIQLQAQGTYAYGPNRDLTNQVTYTVIVDPNNQGTVGGTGILPTPPNTITLSTTGLVTAVEPGVCTFNDVGTLTTPVWVLTGDYEITATYRGVTSQPVYIGVASAAGPSGPPANGACGPTAAQ